ncbi:MAG: hypothetical protein M1355_01920 [Patescibacteria group bacterium]|nr:hypothetical protein [Patescibacteria group bacterium]
MEKIIQKKPLYPEILWKRPVFKFGHKAGKLLIIAGSGLKNKEALDTAEAAFLSGTGVLTLAFPESPEKSYGDFIPKEMRLALPETPSKSLSIKGRDVLLDFANSNDVTVIGPGLSKNSETTELIWQLISEFKNLTIISNEALDSLILGLKLIYKKEGIEGLNKFVSNRKSRQIIIFNDKQLKELRYFALETQKIAETLNSTIILIKKGLTEIFTEKRVIKTFTEGELKEDLIPILSGMIGSFCTQNLDKIPEAIATAVYLFAKSVDLREKDKQRKTLTSYIKKAIREEEI